LVVASVVAPVTLAAGGEVTRLAFATGRSIEGKIAFSSDRVFDGESAHGDRIYNFDIYVMNADGTSPRRLTRQSGVDTSPSWSPDGSRIVYESESTTDEFQINVMRSNGSHDRALAGGIGGRDPSWSPESKSIVFQGGPDLFFKPEIDVMNSDGGRVRRLTRNSWDFAPSWSPSGRSIVFARAGTRPSTASIFIMRADGRGLRRLTRARSFDSDPAFSPDGQKIAFRRGSTKGDIWVMNADGTAQHRVTRDRNALESGIAWAPDGEQIVYSSARTGNGDLYVMNVDGTNQRRLTSGRAIDREPSWQPVQ